MIDRAGEILEFDPTSVREAWKGLKDFGIWAYGGTGYGERVKLGSWMEVEDAHLGDRSGLKSDGTLSFGMGMKAGKRFLIFRQLQDVERRSGTPYTALLNFPENIWQATRYNSALIIKNILGNPKLKELLLASPGDTRTIGHFRELGEADWNMPQTTDSKMIQALKDFDVNSSLVLKASAIERPSPEVMAQVLSSLPEQQRETLTYLIGGMKHQVAPFGTKVIWDHSL